MGKKEKRLARYQYCSPAHFSRWRFYVHLFALRFIFRPILALTYRPKVFGRANVPKEGPFIVVSNHIDTFDPIQVSHAVDYPVAYVAKKELFKNCPMAEFWRFMGCFALDRERPSSGSLKSIFNALRSQAKWAVGMFPEGTRSHTNELLPMKKGAGKIAQKARVPILPIGIRQDNSGRFVLIVGKPIADVSDAEAANQKVYEALVNLTDPVLCREMLASGRISWPEVNRHNGFRRKSADKSDGRFVQQ